MLFLRRLPVYHKVPCLYKSHRKSQLLSEFHPRSAEYFHGKEGSRYRSYKGRLYPEAAACGSEASRSFEMLSSGAPLLLFPHLSAHKDVPNQWLENGCPEDYARFHPAAAQCPSPDQSPPERIDSPYENPDVLSPVPLPA